MLKINKAPIAMMLLMGGLLGWACGPAAAAVRIEGQVRRAAVLSQSSTVTLWAASAERTQATGSNKNWQ